MLKKLIFSIANMFPEPVALRLNKRLVALKNSSGTLSEKWRASENAFMPQYDPDFQWFNSSSFSGTVPAFSHSGSMGDILFSLYFCREFAEYFKFRQFDMHIQTGVTDAGMKGFKHPCGNVRITRQAALFMQSLLEHQPYIRRVTIGDDLPENCMSLDKFRELKINLSSGQIQNWYYNLTNIHLPRKFWEPVLYVEPDLQYHDKIVLSHTSRYQNVYIDCNILNKYHRHIIFAGTAEEYRNFTSTYFDIPYIKADTMLELAQYIAGAKGFIGNQGGLFTIAECLKTPRILLAPEYTVFKGIPGPGPHVNHPQGGWAEDVATTEKMVAAVEDLLKNC